MIVKARIGSNTGIKRSDVDNSPPSCFYHLASENLGHQKKAHCIDFKYFQVQLNGDFFQTACIIQLIRGLIDSGIVYQNRGDPKGICTFLRDGFESFTDRHIGKCQLQAPPIKTSLQFFKGIGCWRIWMIQGKDFGASLQQRIDPDRP